MTDRNFQDSKEKAILNKNEISDKESVKKHGRLIVNGAKQKSVKEKNEGRGQGLKMKILEEEKKRPTQSLGIHKYKVGKDNNFDKESLNLTGKQTRPNMVPQDCLNAKKEIIGRNPWGDRPRWRD